MENLETSPLAPGTEQAASLLHSELRKASRKAFTREGLDGTHEHVFPTVLRPACEARQSRVAWGRAPPGLRTQAGFCG